MAKVEIYTTKICPHCNRAKALLDRKGAEYISIDVTTDEELRMAMMERAGGRRTVPQIFIDDQHIGGADDLYALDKKGGLEPLLAS